MGSSPQLPVVPIRGVEFARFGKQLVVVNHRSSPIGISALAARQARTQIPSGPGWLAAHSATCLEQVI